MSYMLARTSFSIINYDKLLNSWSLQTLQSDVEFTVDSHYSLNAQAARDTLINVYGWNINDDGVVP